MFAHDLCHSRIEYLSNSIDLNRKDRAKRYHKSSIFNRQYSIPACPGWVGHIGYVYLNRDCRFVKERVTFYGISFNRSGDDDGIPFFDDGGFLITAILNTGGTFGTQQ
jgi:hypothetical protein